MDLEAFELVLLRAPENAPAYDDAELERIQAEHLAEADPAVRAGRLIVEIMTWYCPPGTMSKPGRAVTLLARFLRRRHPAPGGARRLLEHEGCSVRPKYMQGAAICLLTVQSTHRFACRL